MPSNDEQRLRAAIRESELFRRSEHSTGLVVFTHGLSSKPADYEDLLVDLLNDEQAPLTDCDLLPFRYRATPGTNTKFNGPDRESRQKYEAVKLNRNIENLHREHDYQKIYLVGHSLGGILIRATVLEGWEEIEGEAAEKDWVSRIKRLVLLASANRGVVIDKVHLRIAFVMARACGRAALLRDALRGSEFMNNQRLGWIFKFQRSDRTPPEIVQVLGDADDTVSKYDSSDIERFPNSKHVVLVGVGHADFRGMNRDHEAYREIRDAFSSPIEKKDSTPTLTQPDARFLVFLIHGIRDFGEWQSTLARAIREREADAKVVSVRYGYFNIFQFLLGFQRSRAVRSFTDRYIEEIANLERPLDEAEVSVAAHSNGTYVLGHALKKYPYMVVNRIYLAGSVLPRNFPWHGLSPLQLTHLQRIRNDCANWDWPVGILCSALRWVFLFRAIGVAGYRGFQPPSGNLDLHNTTYLEGGHGVAFQPHLHANIADYLLSGEPRRPGAVRSGKRIMHAFYAAAPVLLAAIVYGLFKVYADLIPWLADKVTVMPAGPFQVLASALVTAALILLLARI